MTKKLDDLGDWRRTHYSRDLKPILDGREVTVFGWVASIRRQVGVTFIILNDKDGILQITVHKNRSPKDVVEKVDILKEHSSIGVRGVVRRIEKAPHGAEVIPDEIKILGLPSKLPPFNLYGGKLPRIDKRLDLRAVDLRRPKAQAIFRIRHTAIDAARQYFSEKGYFEVNTPKIIATATEGGAALFPLLYYDKEAFLTQSPQLYKEQLVMAFEKVFEIGPAFRAEQSRTLSHLSEFISIDVEEAYIDYDDIMNTLEELAKYMAKSIRRRCKDDLKLLKLNLKDYSMSFKRYTYDEVLKLLSKQGFEVEWGEDLSTAAMDELAKTFKDFYFIIDWPTSSKPFYIKPCEDDARICESFDFMHGSIEIASGGTRISSKKMLVKRLKEKGLKPHSFEYHLKVFDYGMPPHAGFGLGLERLLMALTGQENIREVTLYPRDQFRLTP